jgi:hypothetical protein
MQNALRSHVSATWLVEPDESGANNIESLRICLCLENAAIQRTHFCATIVDYVLRADENRYLGTLWKRTAKCINVIRSNASAAGKTRAATSTATAATASSFDEAAARKAITNGLSTTTAEGRKRKIAAEADAENGGDDDEAAAPNTCAPPLSPTASRNPQPPLPPPPPIVPQQVKSVRSACHTIDILASGWPRLLTSGGQAGPPILIFRRWWYVSLFANSDDDQSDWQPRNSQEGSMRNCPTFYSSVLRRPTIGEVGDLFTMPFY